MNCDFCGGPRANIQKTVWLDEACVKFSAELQVMSPNKTWDDLNGGDIYFTKEDPAGTFAAAPWPVSCSHQLDIVPLPKSDQFLYLSGSMSAKKLLAPDHPDPEAAVYLAGEWIVGSVMSNSVLPSADNLGTVQNPAVLYIEWPDFTVVDVKTLAFAVQWIVDMLKHGKRVEIGCTAGHGRTGTVAAAVLVHMGLKPDEAVAYLKANYCTHVCEAASQCQLVEEYAQYIKTG